MASREHLHRILRTHPTTCGCDLCHYAYEALGVYPFEVESDGPYSLEYVTTDGLHSRMYADE